MATARRPKEYTEGFRAGYEHLRQQLLAKLDAQIASAGFMTRGYFQQARDEVAALTPED